VTSDDDDLRPRDLRVGRNDAFWGAGERDAADSHSFRFSSSPQGPQGGSQTGVIRRLDQSSRDARLNLDGAKIGITLPGDPYGAFRRRSGISGTVYGYEYE
jgi:hypothetical protein